MKRVLIVDDTELSRKLLFTLLAHAGYDVLAAGDAEEARRVFVSAHPDCVISDFHMPGEDGIALARSLRAMCSEGAPLRIALMTGDGAETPVPEGLFDRVIGKPASIVELNDFIGGS